MKILNTAIAIVKMTLNKDASDHILEKLITLLFYFKLCYSILIELLFDWQDSSSLFEQHRSTNFIYNNINVN